MRQRCLRLAPAWTPDFAGERRRLCRGRALGLEQAVEVDDDIFHLGVVDGALGGAAPGFLGFGIAVEQADEVDGIEIGEVEAAGIADAAAEDEMKLAHARPASTKIRRCEPGICFA